MKCLNKQIILAVSRKWELGIFSDLSEIIKANKELSIKNKHGVFFKVLTVWFGTKFVSWLLVENAIF